MLIRVLVVVFVLMLLLFMLRWVAWLWFVWLVHWLGRVAWLRFVWLVHWLGWIAWQSWLVGWLWWVRRGMEAWKSRFVYLVIPTGWEGCELSVKSCKICVWVRLWLDRFWLESLHSNQQCSCEELASHYKKVVIITASFVL